MTDTDTDIEIRVREIIAEQLGIAEDEISLEASISGDLGADLLDIIEVFLALEEEFELEIPQDMTDRMKTVGNVVEHLSRISTN